MRSNSLKETLKTAVLAVTILLFGAGACLGQTTVTLTAAPQHAVLPDGQSVPMWGLKCTPDATTTLLGPCSSLHFNATNGVYDLQTGGDTWQPPLIIVPYVAGGTNSLTINLTNSLSFTAGTGTNTVPTSLVIVGQLGGGLGTTATSTPPPDHTNAQPVTWPVAGTAPGLPPAGVGTPPAQGNRVQSFSTEVAQGATTALTWNNLRPGTYLIESGTHPSIQGSMGLYGVLVVTSAPTPTAVGCAYPGATAGTCLPSASYNAEIPLLLSEIDPVQNNAVQAAVTTPNFSETMVWSGQPGGCGNPSSLTFHQCYPPAVNYTPLYYLFNGVAFNKTSALASLFPVSPATVVPATGTTASVLVRFVNAGLRMHVPSIVGSQIGTAVAPAVPPSGFSLIAEDGNPLPGVPRVQSEVFMAAGKTYDVMINLPTGATALPVFDRELSLSGNSTARDAGMLAYISANGAAAPVAPALASAQAVNDIYNALVAGQTLTVSDPGKGVIANDFNVYGVKVFTPPSTGTLTLNANGTFTYVPSGTATSDTFVYAANGATACQASGSGPCATVTLGAATIESGTGITLNPDSYTSNVATTLSIAPPGVLVNDSDAAGYPLTVAPSSYAFVSGPSTGALTVTMDKTGAFNASATAPGTYTFTYKAQNSQGTMSSGTGTVTLIFPTPSNLAVTVLDGRDRTPIGDYRWAIEEDRTFYVDPSTTTNNGGTAIVPTFGTNFHTSYMPLVATGCIGPTGTVVACEAGQTVYDAGTPCTGGLTPPACSLTAGQHVPAVCDIGNGVCRPGTQQTPVDPGMVHLDPTKRYYISVLPGDAGNPFGNANLTADCTNGVSHATNPAACGHGMGGAPIAAGQTAVTILTQPDPFPPSKLSVFVFEDDFPLNGEQDGGGGIDVLSPNEPGLGSFNITLFDDAGGTGDATGQMTYDMFNQPLVNSLAGTPDPSNAGTDACPISAISRIGTIPGTVPDPANAGQFLPIPDPTQTGITGTIVTCPKYEADGVTLSPLAGQAVVANLMPGRYGVVATPGADRIGRGEEWLQTNTLDGQKAHDSFLRVGEPSFFQEFGPAGYHVSIGFANPAIINGRKAGVCGGQDPFLPGTGNCNNSITGTVTTERMSRTPDERLYSSGDNSSFAFTQCFVSFGDADGEDFAFTKCDQNGQFTLSGLPDGDWRITVFDQWNDMLVDGLSTPVRLARGATLNLGQVAMNQWQANIITKTFIDANGNGIQEQDGTEPGLTLVATNIRFRDGSYSNFNNTDLSGNAGFNEVFPLFSWYVVETDTTRYKSTGTHVVYDAGGPPDTAYPVNPQGVQLPCPVGQNCSNIGAFMAHTAEQIPVPPLLRVPGAKYCATADCLTSGAVGGSTGRIDPAWVATEGWQGFSGQNSFIEFGKKAFAPGETGGIHGEVIYASTRPFDDPGLLIHTSWTPDVPGVTINLYQEGTDPDGVTPTLKLVDTTTTSSWDDWAQGFRSDGVPNMNCPGQGRNTGTNADLFFFSLFNQPVWLDVYNNVLHGTATAPRLLPNNSQFKCYDGMHNWNQVQPAPYDGMYQFPSVTGINPTTGKPAGTNCHIHTTAQPWGCVPNPDATDTYRVGTPMLPSGKYIVEMIVPPGYELVKEEDKNILIGDNYIAPVTQEFPGLGSAIYILPDQAEISSLYNAVSAQNPTQTMGRTSLPSHEGDTGSIETFWPCVGAKRVVPDYISLFPGSHEVSPFAGAVRNLCDRKEVMLDEQTSALAKFWVFTSTHVAAHFTGVITDDFTSEFDPFSPQFGEKFSPPNLPVSIKDWTGTEISRVYADHWGTYDGLTYSTWEVNPPNPTGYAPTMMVTCMNDPGPIPDPAHPGQMKTDDLYNPQYSQFCYEIPFMPGQTQYMDTPVVPTSAFAGAGYNNPDCAYQDLTPAVSEVDGDGIGPWVSATGGTLTITALGTQTVPNNAYSGPSATTTPYNQKTITRRYGFGSSGTVTIGGVAVPAGNISTWNDSTIILTVPDGIPACAVQQQTLYAPGATATQCGELVITRGDNGKQSIDAVTVTIGGKAPTHVGASQSIQSAIDAAQPGDMLIVDPTCIPTAAPAPGTDPCTVPGTRFSASHNELLLMWKPVRLQGVGAPSSIINANTHPAGKLDAWRARVNCLFGLALNGTPNGYDSSCGSGWNGFHWTANNPQIDRLPLEATVGWDASLNGNLAELLQEPSLMGALEGAAITVLSKGVSFLSNPFDSALLAGFPTGTVLFTADNTSTYCDGTFTSNFWCNPSSIDGLSITNSSQGGGGIFVHGWGHNLQIANNRVTNNEGTLSGGINVGQGEYPPGYLQGSATNAPPGSCQSSNVANVQLPYCHDLNVNVHNNAVTSNSSIGDELFSATPAGAGGVTFCTGSDFYKFNYNWVCGNLSTGDGGGLGHIGFSYNGDIEHNTFLFNQSTNPTIASNGGGILVMGAPDVDPPCSTNDQDCVSAPNLIGPSDGTGPGLVINANLIMGNAADSGSGGGLRLQNVNGAEVVSFPTDPTHWYSVTVTNNIIANNVAGWDGAGVSLQDALVVNFINNTVMSNDTTASSGVLFNTLGAPLASSQGTNCRQGGGGGGLSRSCPQPAGLVSIQNSAVLRANLPNSITCPAGHSLGTSAAGSCRNLSVPILENDLFWQNRAFYIGVGSLGTGTKNQQNVVSLFNAFTNNPAASQTITGACVSSASFWDIGVRGDTTPNSNGAGNPRLSPMWSVLSSGGYTSNFNSTQNPTVVSQYCNGSRVPPELGTMGYQVPPGIADATVPNPRFTLTPAATVDEGNNWINLSWGPLSMSNTSGAALGNYALAPNSPAIDYITCNSVPCLATNELIAAPTTDFFGHPRPDALANVPARGAAADVGAVEFQQDQTAVTPTLTSIMPGSGAQGATVPVVLIGTNLIGATAVNVVGPGVIATITSVNSNSVTANFAISATAALGSSNVTVITPIGTTNAVLFTVVQARLTSISPNTGIRGTSVDVTLSGTNLTGATGLTGLGGGVTLAPGSFSVMNDTTITATLNIGPNAAVGGHAIAVTLGAATTNSVTFTVTEPLPAVTLTPAAGADFGLVRVGITPAANAPSQDFTLRNAGPVTFTINAATAGPAPFSRVGGFAGNCGGTLASGASCTIRVRFRPLTAGSFTGLVTVTGTAPGGTADPVTNSPAPLKGTGIQAVAAFSGPVPSLTTTPANTGNESGTVTVTNTGNTPLVISGVTVTGGGGRFTKGADSCTGATIQPQGSTGTLSCTVAVNYAAGGSTTPRNGTLTLTDTGAATSTQAFSVPAN